MVRADFRIFGGRSIATGFLWLRLGCQGDARREYGISDCRLLSRQCVKGPQHIVRWVYE